MDQLLHTPEGVRDIYGEECIRKNAIEERIHKVFKSYAFQDIETPAYEFFDIFNKERGSIASKEMFKFFDRYNNTLVLRPDITPQIARTAAKYFGTEQGPVKLCYQGNTYINSSSYQARLKETTQMGTELIGDSSIDADAEMVAMLIQSLLACGLKEFYVEIGQVQFFNGLVEAAGLKEEIADELRTKIQEKNYFGVEELLKSQNIDSRLSEIFLKLPQMFGSVDILYNIDSLSDYPKAANAIERLKQIYEILKVYGCEKYVSFDLGMLSSLRYYTGIIFKAYTYGTGEFIANGGRYDELIGQFGLNRPSIGFSITVDYLMIAMDRQKITLDNDNNSSFLVLYDSKDRVSAIRLAAHYRSRNVNVSMICKTEGHDADFYLGYAMRHGIGHIVEIKDDKVSMIHVASGNIKTEKLSDILE